VYSTKAKALHGACSVRVPALDLQVFRLLQCRHSAFVLQMFLSQAVAVSHLWLNPCALCRDIVVSVHLFGKLSALRSFKLGSTTWSPLSMSLCLKVCICFLHQLGLPVQTTTTIVHRDFHMSVLILVSAAGLPSLQAASWIRPRAPSHNRHQMGDAWLLNSAAQRLF
jgi:hypothetical protein